MALLAILAQMSDTGYWGPLDAERLCQLGKLLAEATILVTALLGDISLDDPAAYRQRAVVWGRVHDVLEELGMPLPVATQFLAGEPVSVECCAGALDRVEHVRVLDL